MSEYPGLVPKRERTPQQWADWWQEFRKRNGLDKPIPAPPPDAKPPPRPHVEPPEREPGEEG